MHKKRGYFFTLDASLAIFVIVIGVFLLSTFRLDQPEPLQIEFLSGDLIDFLSKTKIEDLNDPYAGIGGQLWTEGKINDKDNSLLQQIGEFYYINDTDTADLFVKQVSEVAVPPQFNYELRINGDIVYPKIQSTEHLASRGNSTLLLTSKKITFGLVNDSVSTVWGPYVAEVFVWQ